MAPSTSTPPLPAGLVNDWLKPAALVGALALPLAAFHGVRQEVNGVRQEVRATETSLRSDFKAELQAVESRLKADLSEFKTEVRSDIAELRADSRALSQKLDRVLESLLQP